MEKRSFLKLAYLTIVLIYLFTFLTVYLLFYYDILSFSMVNVLIADIVATAMVFMFSRIFKNSSIYDPYWSVVPPIISVYLIKHFPEGNSIRQQLVLVLVLFWSIRLTVNWFRGWKGLKHEDWRYISIAEQTGRLYWPVSFFGIHLMPTIFVFLGCLPLWFSLSNSQPFNILDSIAALFTFVAILIEWIADEQLIRFRKKKIKGSFLTTGLWSISRHPNYLGEICFWIGLFLFVLSSSKGMIYKGYWTVIGLVSMIILFKFISIPMMEKRNITNKPDYREYINKVPALFPFFQKSDQ